MPNVVDVRCYRTLDNQGKDRVVVTWNAIVPEVPDITGFNVYRADLDSFLKIKSGVTQNFYLDEKADLFPGKEYYYKVTATYGTTGETDFELATKINIYADKPAGLRERLYWILAETIRRINLAFDLQGEAVKIYIKKLVGTKCPRCHDPLGTRGTDPRCSICYGTGIVGGFDSYERSIVIYDATKSLPQTPFGIKMAFTPRGVIANYPILHDGSLFKRQDGQAYMIADVTPTYMQNYLIEQQFGLSQMEPGHVVYRLP